MAVNYNQPISSLYNHIVDLDARKCGGWGVRYYGTVSNVINKNRFSTVVEVGIGYGLHAKELLKNSCLEKLYLIDPMCYYPNDSFSRDIMTTIPEKPGNQFNELFELINKELSPWNSRYEWLRIPSLEVTNAQIADGSVDCVFVDGDHSYSAVKKDLAFWWKKIRVGGMLLGDDYWMSDVSRAVHEFATEIGVNVSFAENPADPSYRIFQFEKT